MVVGVGGEVSAVEASPAAAGVSSSCRRAMERMRVGCHLNIAAAFLLRKTDYESAVDHCTRVLVIDPCNTQALVRRAQAYQALGRFRSGVEDLEAAEASVLASIEALGALGPPVDGGGGGDGQVLEELEEELVEVVRRLEHARWTKIHVGNGKDVLERAGAAHKK